VDLSGRLVTGLLIFQKRVGLDVQIVEVIILRSVIQMKLKLGEEKIKGFSSPVKKAEKTNDWAWWGLFMAMVIMVILVILRILDKI